MNKLFTKIATLSVGLAMAIGVGVAIGSNSRVVTQVEAAAGDVLKTYDTNSSTFTTGYARKSGDNFVWWGQKGYFGANNATNHGKCLPTAADLPVVKAQNTSASTSTTGLYYLYTSEAVANVGSVQVYLSAKSGSSTVNAYVVSSSTAASSGSATWSKVTLASTSASVQGANVAAANTYTFTFNATETTAKYYGVVFSTSSYWRATGLTFKLLEGDVKYTVTYNPNGGTVSPTSEQVSKNGHPTFPTPSYTGYTFDGWQVNGAGTYYTSANASSYTVLSAVTFVAHWTSASAESITVTGSSSLYVDDSDITLTATPENFSPATYTWNSSNTGVATISGSGATATLHAVSKGTTVITASASGTGGTVTSNEFTVTIKRFSIALSSNEVSMKASKSTTVTVTPTDANGTVAVTAESNDTSVATVSVSGTTITINSGSVGGVSTTITVSAKDNGGASGYHTAVNQTISVEVTSGYTVGAQVTALPSEDTLVFLIANVGTASARYVTSSINTTSTNDEDASLFYLSSGGVLQQFDLDTDTRGKYVYNGGGNTTISAGNSAAYWASGMDNSTYPGLLQLSGGRFLSIDGNGVPKAYASSNLGSYDNIYAYLAVASTPTATLSGSSVTAFKGDSNDTSLTLTLANFTASGLTVSYMDDGEEEYAASSSIATVTCGHTTGDNTVTVAFGAIGSTTVKLTITRSNGSPFEKTFTVTVKEKPGSITINNTLEDGYLVIENGTTAQEGYTELNVTAKQAAPDQSSDYTGLLKYTVTTGGDYVGVSATGRVYGKAAGTGTVRVYANDLTTVEAFINVKVMDDYRNGVSSVTFNANLTTDAGDALDISEVFATKVATTRFGSTDTIADEELKFSYAPSDYENAVGAAEFFYACEETTEEGETEVQTVYVYCTLDESWSSSFSITVTQTSIDLTGLSINGVIGNEMNLLRNTTHQISLTFTPSNASDKSVTYSIDDELSDEGHSVTVSNTGLISAGTAVGKSAMVVVTSNFDSSISDYVVVTVTRETMTLTADMPASYVKVTSTADLTSGKYLIVSEASNVVMTEAVNSTANKTTYENIDSSLNSYCFTYNASTGSLKGPNGSYIGKTASGNGMDVGSTEYTHTITFDNGNAVITASGGSILRYNTSWGGFRYYGSGQQAVQLYKQSGGETEVTVTDALFAVVDAAMTGSNGVYGLSLCDASGLSFNVSAWNSLGSDFTSAIINDNKLAYARADQSGNEVEQFLYVYDYVIGKKEAGFAAYSGANDFLGRVASGKINSAITTNPLNAVSKSAGTTIAIIVITTVSLAAIGGYFLFRKKKED